MRAGFQADAEVMRKYNGFRYVIQIGKSRVKRKQVIIFNLDDPRIHTSIEDIKGDPATSSERVTKFVSYLATQPEMIRILKTKYPVEHNDLQRIIDENEIGKEIDQGYPAPSRIMPAFEPLITPNWSLNSLGDPNSAIILMQRDKIKQYLQVLSEFYGDSFSREKAFMDWSARNAIAMRLAFPYNSLDAKILDRPTLYFCPPHKKDEEGHYWHYLPEGYARKFYVDGELPPVFNILRIERANVCTSCEESRKREKHDLSEITKNVLPSMSWKLLDIEAIAKIEEYDAKLDPTGREDFREAIRPFLSDIYLKVNSLEGSEQKQEILYMLNSVIGPVNR